MKYYEFRFEHKTRPPKPPFFRKMRYMREFKVFPANDLSEAYLLARKYWTERGVEVECEITLIRELPANRRQC